MPRPARQLAHGSDTQKISNFTNVREMYECIARAFGIKFEDVRVIMHCRGNGPTVCSEY
jgi:hypothetical protein